MKKFKSLNQSFGLRIKEIREIRKLNQEQLAELVNMESRHISRIETGKSFTTLENISKIAKALDVDINELFIFEHKNEKSVLQDEIYNYIKNADTNQIELLYRIAKAIFN